jgi:glutathione S-transferase
MTIKIYGDGRSGNCYKLQLLAAILSIPHEWVHTDIMAGEARTEEFKNKNPASRIPVLELKDGRFISESNAILNYLAFGSGLLPTGRYELAKVMQWQFFEQYSHEPYIAVARYIALYLGMPEDRKEEFESKQAGGYKALSVMELQLQQTPFLTGEQMTTADIALYGYTHIAGDGGFDLSAYKAINDWLKRIEDAPGYVAMSW